LSIIFKCLNTNIQILLVLIVNMCLRLEEQKFDCWQGQEIFLFSITSRPALGSTYPPIPWVPRAVYLGIKQLGDEADHSSPSSAKVKSGGAIPPLQGIVLD
jgi:hypothetical protein